MNVWMRGTFRVCSLSSPVAVIDSISKPGCVDDGQSQLDSSFFDQDFRLLHLRENNIHTVTEDTDEEKL